MINEEYASADGLITVDYIKGHIPEQDTNKIWCHSYSEFMIIIKGSVTYSDNKGVTKVSDKSAVFIKAHEVHNPFVQYSQVYERYRVRFHGNFAADILCKGYNIDRELSVSYKKGLSDSDFSEVLSSVKNLFEVIKRKSEKPEDKLRERMYLMCALTKSADSIPRHDATEKNYIYDVIEYVKKHYKTHLTAQNIATDFFVSRGKLIYDFKAYSDMTLLEYITLTRLEAAKEMLLSGYSVSFASESCGFSSPSYFIKVFSGVVGMTPLKFQMNFQRKD